MAEAGLVNLVFFIFFIVLPLWSAFRIVRRAGYSGWWTLGILVPGLNIVLLWIFAFSEWPRHSQPAD